MIAGQWLSRKALTLNWVGVIAPSAKLYRKPIFSNVYPYYANLI